MENVQAQRSHWNESKDVGIARKKLSMFFLFKKSKSK